MGVLEVILLSLNLLAILGADYLLFRIWKSKPEQSRKQDEAKVTDPFTKPKEVYSSTNHIIVPKTPTEIRNQNFKKIKEGIEYGDFDRG